MSMYAYTDLILARMNAHPNYYNRQTISKRNKTAFISIIIISARRQLKSNAMTAMELTTTKLQLFIIFMVNASMYHGTDCNRHHQSVAAKTITL